MTLNRHGHHIKNTPFDDENRAERPPVICSGSPFCATCAQDAGLPVNVVDPAVV